MEYRTLGGTGLQVSTHCLGTMMFGAWGNTDVDDCVATINAAIDGGINFVDTADVYSSGESEEIVGRALRGRRDEVILATKVHGQMGPGRNDEGNSRVWIMKEVENSLRRLGTDHIDLYQIHRPDGDTDVEETLGALTDLQRQGKIRCWSLTYPGGRWWSAVDGRAARLCGSAPGSRRTRSSSPDQARVLFRPDATGWVCWSEPAVSRLADGAVSPRGLRSIASHARCVAQRTGSRRSTTSRVQSSGSSTWSRLILLAGRAGISLTHMAIAFTSRTASRLPSSARAAGAARRPARGGRLAPGCRDAGCDPRLVPPGTSSTGRPRPVGSKPRPTRA